jgi:tRNA-modifying protein YgfZ
MSTASPDLAPNLPPAASSVALVAARDNVVACDLGPLSVLSISGVDAEAFLQGQLSSDVSGVADGGAQYTSFNSPKGRMLANFVLWRESGGDFRALLPGDLAAPIGKRLAMFVLRSKVTVADVSADSVRFGIGGPKAADELRAAFGEIPPTLGSLHRDGATLLGLPGPRYVILVPAAAAAATGERLARGAVRAPFSVWQWLTIRAGVPVVTAPTQDQLIAQSANWDVLGGVNFRKGCYTGQEIIARMQYLGRQKERLYAFHADSAAVTRVFGPAFGDQPCGIVVNAAPAPEGGHDLLAVVQLAAAETGNLRLSASDGAALAPRPLPYAVPPPQAPRGRVST